MWAGEEEERASLYTKWLRQTRKRGSACCEGEGGVSNKNVIGGERAMENVGCMQENVGANCVCGVGATSDSERTHHAADSSAGVNKTLQGEDCHSIF